MQLPGGRTRGVNQSTSNLDEEENRTQVIETEGIAALLSSPALPADRPRGCSSGGEGVGPIRICAARNQRKDLAGILWDRGAWLILCGNQQCRRRSQEEVQDWHRRWEHAQMFRIAQQTVRSRSSSSSLCDAHCSSLLFTLRGFPLAASLPAPSRVLISQIACQN